MAITLESLAKIAHTRSKGDGNNVLHILTEHLLQTHPLLLQALAKDLDGCWVSKDIDPKDIATKLTALTAEVSAIESLSKQVRTPDELHQQPDALNPTQLKSFLATALPKVINLHQLNSDLEQATADLRRWFAEPPESRLAFMFQNLAALRGALPENPNLRVRKVTRSRTAPARTLSPTKGKKVSDSPATGPAEDSLFDFEMLEHLEDPFMSFEGPLENLKLALTQIHGRRESVTTDAAERKADDDDDGDSSIASETTVTSDDLSDEEPDIDDFEAPLATLRSVLGNLRPRSRLPSSEADRSLAADQADTLFAFEGPLASLQGALKALQTPRIDESQEEEQSLWLHSGENHDREKPETFEAPLADLQNVLQHLKPPPREFDYASNGFGAHLADLQGVLKQLKSPGTFDNDDASSDID